MIIYEDNEIGGLYTQGFETVIPSPMLLKVNAGEIVFDHKEPIDYPEFEFEVESDEELYVGYDVYLLTEENEDGDKIVVERVELGLDTVQCYTGETELLHTLISFIIPPQTTNLADIEIRIRNFMGASSGEEGDPE